MRRFHPHRQLRNEETVSPSIASLHSSQTALPMRRYSTVQKTTTVRRCSSKRYPSATRTEECIPHPGNVLCVKILVQNSSSPRAGNSQQRTAQPENHERGSFTSWTSSMKRNCDHSKNLPSNVRSATSSLPRPRGNNNSTTTCNNGHPPQSPSRISRRESFSRRTSWTFQSGEFSEKWTAECCFCEEERKVSSRDE